MKKIFLIIVCFMMMNLSACFEINDNDLDENDTINKKEVVEIVLCDDSSEYKYEVVIGEIAQITEMVKKGYVSRGYFDSKSGGEKYFDADGKSLSVWSVNYPKVFYVQYQNINEYRYSKMYFDKEEAVFGYYRVVKLEFGAEFNNAIKANLDKKIKVSYEFIAYDDYWNKGKDVIFYFKNVDKYNEGGMYRDQIINAYNGKEFVINSSYQNYSYYAYIDAQYVYNGSCLAFIMSRGATTGDCRVKNLLFTIEFE